MTEVSDIFLDLDVLLQQAQIVTVSEINSSKMLHAGTISFPIKAFVHQSRYKHKADKKDHARISYFCKTETL